MAMTFRTDDDLDRMLSELAESQGVSKQEVIRRAIVDLHERSGHRARVDAVASEVLLDYAEALDRLGAV